MQAALMKQAGHLKAVAYEAERRFGHFSREAFRIKAAIEDRIDTARRAVKHGYRATEDFVDDTTHRIKRDPLRAVGLSFVVGATAGWCLMHRRRG
jgi:ElaB/YqjD/DUF883 family membrane-anchored ribosome-binding protein